MKYNKSLFLFFLGLSGINFLEAQEIERQLTAATGTYHEQAETGNLHFSVGEVATLSFAQEGILSLGFHQGAENDMNSTSTEEIFFPTEMQLYPNPTARFIQFSQYDSKEYKLVIRDVLGRIVFTKEKVSSSARLDVDFLISGFYTLTLNDSITQLTFKFQKIES